MKEAEGLSYQEIVMRTGLSRSLVTARYCGWKAAQAAGGASPAEGPAGPGG
jgi:transcription elongation factor